MAAKSDFAQKLLRDLRLRKERMGSAHANATAGDGYRNQRNVQIGGSKTTNQQLISSNGSTQIVSYTTGHHQRSKPISDLSMAFTYAVKNGGNTNPMLDFLHQIGRRSLDLGNTRNQKTTTTAIQIKEISKGVQNLYEIIRSSSNGSNVNRYSMEVGKELLKGAKGLEESLRMLVNLQAGSELTVLPKRKSRVTLLEVDDEDKDDRLGQNRVDLPRFSFDKPSRKSNLVLTDGSNKVCTRRKTASCGGESVGSVKNYLGRSEKGRISNIIVKLMGLDEVVEFKNANDLNNNTINTISIPVKDGRKPQYFHDSNENTIKTSKIAKNGVDRNFQQILDAEQSNDRLDQISEKEKIRVQKNYTNRVEKSNEIKLVPRNNKIQEPEKRVQKSKQNSTKTKKTKNTNSAPKEPKTITFEQNPKAKITRKKVDSRVDSRTEAPRTKNEILKPRNRNLNNLTTPSKHKLSIFKEPKKKDTKSDENSRRRTESTIGLDKLLPMISQVPECEQIKSDPEITSKIIDVGSSERIIETSNISKHKPS